MARPFNESEGTLSGRRRQQYGFVTSWENDAGRTLSVHRLGTVRGALPDVIDTVLGLDPSFRLVAYSTPESILTDITGGRADFVGMKGSTVRVRMPELQALVLVGRKDLLHPRLRFVTRQEIARMDVPE